MRIHTFFRRTLLSLVIILTAGGALLPGAAQDDENNLLKNPGFEGQYSTWSNYMTAQTAPDWNPWWQSAEDDDLSWRLRMPEWKPASPWRNRIHSGDNAQQYFTFYGTHVAGVYQRAAVDPGDRLRFTIWVQVWSSAYDDANISEADGQLDVWVGIDPTGGTDPFSGDIVWSLPKRQYDEWFLMSVEATAAANQATVYVRSEPQYPVKHNDVYIDDALLVVIGQEEPPPGDPTPTPEEITPATQRPTTPPQQNTPVPTSPPTNTVTYTVVAGDSLYKIAALFDNVTVDDIVAANDLTNADFLRIGQKLLIPNQVPPTAVPPTATPNVVQPQPTQPPQPQPQPQPDTHVVQAGENLFRIALRYGTSVEELARINGIVNPNIISVGQVLRLPGATTGTGGPTTTQPGTHVVQPGENAFRIALRYGTTVEAIAAANGIRNYNLIYAGQRLVIP